MNHVDYDSRYATGRPINARPDHGATHQADAVATSLMANPVDIAAADLAVAVAAIADAVAQAALNLRTEGQA